MLPETTPSSMAASQSKYNTKQMGNREFSLPQGLWYWLLVHEVTGLNHARTLYFCHPLFLCFYVTDFVHKSYLLIFFISKDQSTSWFSLLFNLTHCHTNCDNHDPVEQPFRKHSGKRKKCSIFSFSHNVFNHSQNKLKFFSRIYFVV